MTTKVRKTQEERSRETKTRLFEATLDSLQELGYHGASLSQILDRAGVSRGAWRHHFENKKDLVAAAAEYILEKAIQTSKQLAPDIQKSEDLLENLFDFIWTHFYTGRHRDVWLEFNIACRTDHELRERLTPVLNTFHKMLDAAWRTYFTTTNISSIKIETIMNLSINAMRGMAVQSISHNDPDYYKNLRQEWIKIISPLIQFDSSL
jgi:AcrR family transcriptional regulator